MTSFIDYLLMIVGIFVVMITSIIIFLDKLKGEDIYLNLEMKEQELKKVMEDADEVISEINYISDVVVTEIEDKVRNMQNISQAIHNMNTYTAVPVQASQAKDTYTSMQQMPQNVVLNDNRNYDMPQTRKDLSHINMQNGQQKNESPVSVERNERESKLNTKQKKVFDYAAQGMSVAEIAKKMNMGQGEVMLILSIKHEV